ncbi:cation:dicarboxylase symporter family transporter [Sediminibacillus dalangtanensis]|uniref:Cation:dicarboxylase symporter family transporter n=1 Tax=Sediminibacillus dalangtanensis TaxID=2729421 RepID=A0ABX7VWN6_9BACI|nr:dicarboxylate/amino acid:cation symporter [Sediminibacillus dalangtanensis]QTN01087.1 cation:dicarboxylase symporter family transporter [Sediminibacillus dalangtanensis]
MKKVWRGYLDTSLIVKITTALILGVITGLLFGSEASILEPLGDLLIRLLKFLIIPLVLFTLMVGINQTKTGSLGRTGGKVFLYYIVSSAFAIIIGVTIAGVFQPGTGMTLGNSEAVEVPDNPGMASVLLNIVPDNIATAFTELNLLGIIFTAFAFGIAISSLRSSENYAELGENVYNVINGLNEATLTIMKVILQYVPIGIFAIVANTVGSQGFDTLLELGNMVAVLYIALIAQVLLYAVFLLLAKFSPGRFFSQARTPMLTAFATQSSSGTLPLTLNAADNLGLSRSLYGFNLPLGATINMDGAAIRIAVSAVFAANIIGDPLSFTDMLQVVLIGTLASIGTAGVPGAGIIMIATVFAQLNLPMEAVGLLTAIDALVGMGCTALNVTGDLVGTSIIDKTEARKPKTAANG